MYMHTYMCINMYIYIYRESVRNEYSHLATNASPSVYILICNSDVDSRFLCSPLIKKGEGEGGVKACMLYVSRVYTQAMPSPVDDPLHESHYKQSNLNGRRLIPIWLYKVKRRA